jgi:hypothetical protein
MTQPILKHAPIGSLTWYIPDHLASGTMPVPGAMDHLPKRATKHFEKGRELLKEAKGLK